MGSHAIGFVPARGGSVAVPRKNLRAVGGKPLVVRAVETARSVPALASVILSTDDEEVAAAGRGAGAEVPFLRPPELATAEAPVLAALAHTVAWLDRDGRRAEWIVMVQPTSPFVRPATVAAALAHAQQHGLALVQTVSPVKEHPAWVRVPAGLTMSPFRAERGSLRRQDLPELFVLNGAVNVYRADAIRANALPAEPGFIVIDRREGFDIDDEFDLLVAQLLAAAPGTAAPGPEREESSHAAR